MYFTFKLNIFNCAIMIKNIFTFKSQFKAPLTLYKMQKVSRRKQVLPKEDVDGYDKAHKSDFAFVGALHRNFLCANGGLSYFRCGSVLISSESEKSR